MKILIPTAKEMNLSLKPHGKCFLSEQTKTIVASLSQYSIEELAKLRCTSPYSAFGPTVSVVRTVCGTVRTRPRRGKRLSTQDIAILVLGVLMFFDLLVGR